MTLPALSTHKSQASSATITPQITLRAHSALDQELGPDRVLWPRSAQMEHSCVPLAQAAVKTATRELPQALPGIYPMYPLPIVCHLHLSSVVVGLSPCW